MNVYYNLCFLSAFAIGIAFLNQYIRRVQTTIAITAGALIGSLSLLAAGWLGWFKVESLARNIFEQIDFQHFLLNGILGFLLFAGALEINLSELRNQKWEITVLALFSTLLSTLVIGYTIYALIQWMDLSIDLIYCLLFGALISPTDPIAVLAIIKTLKAPRCMSIQIEGESLFNDGVGLVIFTTLFAIAFSGREATFHNVALVFFQEALGGVIYGLVIGLVAHLLITATEDSGLELLITLLVPTTGFALANLLHVSGALAMVVSGILVGNWTRQRGFSKQGRFYLDQFWALVDRFLNALLFLLIGLTLLLIEINKSALLLMVMAIPICLLARYISVVLPFMCFRYWRSYNPYTVPILAWGGLRGGLALAMALSIPKEFSPLPDASINVRDLILMMTYAVVLFSILIQGSTVEPMIKKAKLTEGQ